MGKFSPPISLDSYIPIKKMLQVCQQKNVHSVTYIVMKNQGTSDVSSQLILQLPKFFHLI